jgi:hypothetical protein
MKYGRPSMTSLLGVLSLGMLLAGGCASNGGSRSESAVTSMAQTRQRLVDGKVQIDSVLASMNAMQGSTDLAAAFAAFSDQVDKTQSDADKTKSRVADMKANEQEYIQKWQEEMTTVTDPTLKATAEARRQAVASKFDSVTASCATARDSYNKFYSDLSGIRTYLSNDRTPDGVAASGASMDQATADGKTLKANIDVIIAQLDAITATMPATPASN